MTEIEAESSCACGFSADMCRAFLAFEPPRKCCANCTHWEVTTPNTRLGAAAMIDYEQKYKRLIVAIATLSEDCLSSEGVYPWRWTDEETGKVIAEAIAEAASLQPTS